MTRLGKILALPLVFGLLAMGSPAQADVERGSFDVTVRGIKAATLQYAARMEGTSYAVTGKLQTTGLLGSFIKASYDAETKGRLRDQGFQPSSFYEVRRSSSNDQSTAQMNYRNGTPQVKSYDPPRTADPNALDPSTQAGTIDPMTAIYASLRNQPREKVCNQQLIVFDGKRRSQVTLTNARDLGNGRIGCQGQYRRIAGWSPERLAEKTRFPFQMVYADRGDGVFEVVEVTTDTSFGTATLRRR